MSDRNHERLHRTVRRLRQLLGHVNSECARCDSFRNSERARLQSSVQHGRIVSSDIGRDGVGNSVADLHRYAQVKAGYIDTNAVPEFQNYENFSSYAVQPGKNRSFFQYSPLSSSVSVTSDLSMGSITTLFNAYCSEAGVQCTVTSDPTDFAQLFHFKNVGDRLVRITHHGATRFIEPGEYVTMKVSTRDAYNLNMADALPRIEAINGGL